MLVMDWISDSNKRVDADIKCKTSVRMRVIKKCAISISRFR